MQGSSTEVWAETQRSDVGVICDLQRQTFLTQFNNQIISKIQMKLKVNNLARLKYCADSLSVLTVLIHLFVCLLKD